MSTKRDWWRRILLQAVAALQKRPPSRRGPYIITDEQLRNCRATIASSTPAEE